MLTIKRYDTQIIQCDDRGIAQAAELLRQGELVAIPTETVYGLAANALSEEAVAHIFEVKSRPADNPLITHIANAHEAYALAANVSDDARTLMNEYWPGPLTIVLRRSKDSVPDIVTAGLDTLTLRLPAHETACAVIHACGFPLAAPSANLSTRPSPTTATHVYDDMRGRIPLILDGGNCGVGLESTVVDMSAHIPTVLRPGAVTFEDLQRTLGREIYVAPGVDKPITAGEQARSPGMRHRHYAPNAPVMLASDEQGMLSLYAQEKESGGKPVLLCAGNIPKYTCIPLGHGGDMGRALFAALRMADKMGATRIICQKVDTNGIGRAIMNRLLRAAETEEAKR